MKLEWRKKIAGIGISILVIISMLPLGAFADDGTSISDERTIAASEDVIIESDSLNAEDDSLADTADENPKETEAAEKSINTIDIENCERSDKKTQANAVLSAQGTSVSPNGGKGSGTLNNNTTSKSFDITLTTAGRLTIAINSEIDLSMRSLANPNSGFSLDKGSSNIIDDLAPGTYTLTFRRYNSSNSGSFSFTTSFVSANETITKENNTINIVRNDTPIQFGKRINGQLADNDDEDYYKVVLPSSGRLYMDVHNDIEKLEIFLYDDWGDSVRYFETSMNRGDDSFFADLTAGTYYLRYFEYNNTGTYNFKLKFTPSGETYSHDNNSFNAVRENASIPLSKEIKGQIADNDSCDYYKVYIPQKRRYNIKLKSDVYALNFNIYDSNENLISGYAHHRGSQTYKCELSKGIYFIEMNSSFYTGNYNFSVTIPGAKKAASTTLKKPSIKKVKRGKKSFTVKWKKQSGVSGYQIQYGRKGKAKRKIVSVKKASAKSKKIKRLKAKKKYVVRIRSYKVSNGKTYYSAWSSYKTVKTK